MRFTIRSCALTTFRMATFRFAFMTGALVLVLAVLACSGRTGPSFYLGGIQVNEADHAHWARSLKKAGMNTVAVTVYAHQGDWDSENLWFDETNESVISEIRTAKENGLHVVLIMRVALDHAFERNRFLWHGMIQPKSDSQLEEWFRRYERFVLTWARIAEAEDVDVFGIGSEMNSLTSTSVLKELPPLHAYYLDPEGQAKHHQRLVSFAQTVSTPQLLLPGGAQFGSLSEYLSAKQHAHTDWARQVSYEGSSEPLAEMNARRQALESYWRSLIKDVRREFHGKITYAANFDQYHLVQFWEKLDIMGVNAYFPLRKSFVPDGNPEVLSPILESSWKEVLNEIDKVRIREGVPSMPVIFTELGYTHRQNSTIEPWAMDGFSVLGDGAEGRLIVWGEQQRNFKERTAALRALHRAERSRETSLLGGILYWKLSTEKSHLAIEPFVHILGDPEDKAFAETLASFR